MRNKQYVPDRALSLENPPSLQPPGDFSAWSDFFRVQSLGSYEAIFYIQTYGTGQQNQNILFCSRMKREEIVWNMKQARGLKRVPKGNLFCNETFGVEAFNSESLLWGLSLRFRCIFESVPEKAMGLSVFPICLCLECERKKKERKIIFDSLK